MTCRRVESGRSLLTSNSEYRVIIVHSWFLIGALALRISIGFLTRRTSGSHGWQDQKTYSRNLLNTSDLRATQRAEIEIRDVAHNLRIRIPWPMGQLLPRRICRERSPLFSKLRRICEGQHVVQARHPRADQRISKEHRRQPSPRKNPNLRLVKHLHLARVRDLARAFVGAKLKDPLLLFRRHQLRPAGKR